MLCVTVANEFDASRGGEIVAVSNPSEAAEQFAAYLISRSDQPLLPSRSYWLKIGVDEAARSRIRRQMPKCPWFIGLSCSCKPTIANLFEERLLTLCYHIYREAWEGKL